MRPQLYLYQVADDPCWHLTRSGWGRTLCGGDVERWKTHALFALDETEDVAPTCIRCVARLR